MKFDLGVVLSLATGKMLVNPIEIHEATDYIYSQYNNIFLDVEQAAELTSEYILYLHPQLENVVIPDGLKTWEDCRNFVDSQKNIYGDSLFVMPMTEIISFELTAKGTNRKR